MSDDVSLVNFKRIEHDRKSRGHVNRFIWYLRKRRRIVVDSEICGLASDFLKIERPQDIDCIERFIWCIR